MVQTYEVMKLYIKIDFIFYKWIEIIVVKDFEMFLIVIKK
jgi:hypothetical protein